MTPREAFFAARETVAAEAAGGRVAAEMVVPYPPGIPAIAPGEVVSQELVDALREAAAGGTQALVLRRSHAGRRSRSSPRPPELPEIRSTAALQGWLAICYNSA